MPRRPYRLQPTRPTSLLIRRSGRMSQTSPRPTYPWRKSCIAWHAPLFQRHRQDLCVLRPLYTACCCFQLVMMTWLVAILLRVLLRHPPEGRLVWPDDIFITCLVQVGVISCSCLAGFYGDPSRGIQCKSCGANAMSRGGANLALASCFCSHGFYGVPNGTSRAPGCRRCPSNSSTPASLEKNSSIADCECNRGYYGNPGAFDGVSQACTPCPPNTFNNATGAFLASACAACSPGFVSPAASVDVTQCTPVASSDSCPANSTCR